MKFHFMIKSVNLFIQILSKVWKKNASFLGWNCVADLKFQQRLLEWILGTEREVNLFFQFSKTYFIFKYKDLYVKFWDYLNAVFQNSTVVDERLI